MDPDEAKRQFLADLERHTEGLVIGFPVQGERSRMLDLVRDQYEQMIGQPCLAQWSADGESIEITTPVVRLP